jgi:hypothetical protein
MLNKLAGLVSKWTESAYTGPTKLTVAVLLKAEN